MHRIRLHAQWKRDTSTKEVSRFFRAFHAPTGLQATDRVYLTATLVTDKKLLHQLKVRLNNLELPIQITDTILRVDLTQELKPYNQLQFEWPNITGLSIQTPDSWPFENLVLEIHSHVKTE